MQKYYCKALWTSSFKFYFFYFVVLLNLFSHHHELDSKNHTYVLDNLRRQSTRLLGRPGGNGVHQRGGQRIVRLQTDTLELAADTVHARRVKALLDEGRDKGSKLRLLPVAGRRGQLGVHKVEAVEGVGLFNAAVQVDAAVLAGVALDGGGLVDNGQLVLVGGDLDCIAGHDADDRKESALGLPAL